MIPFGKNILIKKIEVKRVIKSDQAAFTDIGEVLVVGDGASGIKVGDKIGYLYYGCSTIQGENGETYDLIPCTDEFIMCIL